MKTMFEATPDLPCAASPFHIKAVRAHVAIDHDRIDRDRLTAALLALPGVQALSIIDGKRGLTASVETASTQALDALLDRIGALPGVRRTTSRVVLSIKPDDGQAG